jgi:hypothetical protein
VTFSGVVARHVTAMAEHPPDSPPAVFLLYGNH